jgi:hypothetical protein
VVKLPPLTPNPNVDQTIRNRAIMDCADAIRAAGGVVEWEP